jgi:Icc-related predicted phosphoesterase
MRSCFFVSDLHGKRPRYAALFAAMLRERPAAVFLGGDVLPSGPAAGATQGFVSEFLAPGFEAVRERLGDQYPRVFLILGNDDARMFEPEFLSIEHDPLWTCAHSRKSSFGETPVYGYSYVPPTPFSLKDWERYDVSHFVDPGCISPEEGRRTVDVEPMESRYRTIAGDLELLVGDHDVSGSIFLFHAPPYHTDLDRAALDDKSVDYAPLDVHVGSIAVRRFIESRQPRLTLHGHVHESARLTGSWKDRIGRTVMLSAAHDGPELALVRFDAEDPPAATRELI